MKSVREPVRFEREVVVTAGSETRSRFRLGTERRLIALMSGRLVLTLVSFGLVLVLDGAGVASVLGDAPILTSEGRSYPVDTRYRPMRTPHSHQRRGFDEELRRAVLSALSEEGGSILVFLPGVAEIRRLEAALRSVVLADDVVVAPLHGQLDAAAQDAAIRPAPPSGGSDTSTAPLAASNLAGG